ncbi:MAG TPA: hypothetical protein PKC74_01805 [Turneriella sp.]|nr:hypothetical protein [Turneriella sp.]
MNYQVVEEIECSSCGEKVSPSVARVAGDADFDDCTSDLAFLCTVCFIQAKNAAMQASLVGAALSRG